MVVDTNLGPAHAGEGTFSAVSMNAFVGAVFVLVVDPLEVMAGIEWFPARSLIGKYHGATVYTLSDPRYGLPLTLERARQKSPLTASFAEQDNALPLTAVYWDAPAIDPLVLLVGLLRYPPK